MTMYAVAFRHAPMPRSRYKLISLFAILIFPQPHTLYTFRLKLTFSASSSFFLTTLSFSLTADCIITVAVVMSQL